MLHCNIRQIGRAYSRTQLGDPFRALRCTQASPPMNAILDFSRIGKIQQFQLVECPGRKSAHTVTWVPTSTTRPVGIWKKSVASLADFAKPMNKRSCQRGMPDWAEGLSERRDRK